ncbi:gamma-glutamyltransferase [Dyella sp.]|uniref:gamma-glutamyltransferase n=1 Tax=Dyella sp. TaxID=1869338 RepID=UPI003F816567
MRHTFFPGLATALLLSAPLASWGQSATVQDSIPKQALDATAAPTTLADLSKDQPVTAKHAMVSSDQHLSTEVGVQILKQGGNAVDAAVAVGYAQAVVNPCCGNIGGGGFMLVHLSSGKDIFLDFREKAPLKAGPEIFQDAQGNVVPGKSTGTYLGVGVPGTVMGLEEALKKYGTMTRQQVMAPAIKLAKEGFVLLPGDVKVLDQRVKDFAKYPNVAAIFLKDGKPFVAGDRLVQPQLAKTLETISKGGPDAFYHGDIARKIIEASDANGGLFTQKDFDDYTVQWDKPIRCGYRGYTVVSDPPPSSGGVTVCQILQLLEPYPLKNWGYGSTRALHFTIEAERRAYADRNNYLGDPAFVKNPIEQLLDRGHIDQLRSTIDPAKATPSTEIKGSLGATEGTNTTSYAVVDKHGNAVAVTYTINYLFGVGQIAGDTGFFLNNEMDDFTSKPGVPNTFGLVQGKANQVEGGKRPLSSMAPTIVLKDGKLFMVTGSPGGSTIITTVMQSITNVIDYGMNMQQAVNAPRMHHQWYPDAVIVEPGLLTDAVKKELEDMGYQFKEVQSWGADEAILRNPKTGLLEGANDRRRPAGLAAGY